MSKQKTKSSAKKRFKVTGTGKIKRKHAFKNHILTKKSKKRKLKLTHSSLVSDSDLVSIKKQLRLPARLRSASAFGLCGSTRRRNGSGHAGLRL